MAKKIKFPLEMRDGIQVRTLEELRENFDIEKTVGYLVDGKLITWLEDRYYLAEAEIIKEMDAFAPDVKNKLCAALGIELLVDTEINVEKIEQRKIRLTKLKQYTDDEKLWAKVDQVAFDQEDLADLLDENLEEIFLCANEFQIPYAVGNVTYRGIGEVSVFINSSGQIDLEKQKIKFKDIQLLNSNIEDSEQLYQKGLDYLWGRNGKEYDEEKALEYLKKAMDIGHLEAGARFFNEIADDSSKIEKHGETEQSIASKVEELTQNGGLFALRLEGVMRDMGYCFELNRTLGIELILKAAERGCAHAFEDLYHIASDAEEEFRWLQEGIKYQSAFCANLIGRGYEEGWWGLPVDKNKANEYFLMSIDFEENGEPDEGSAYYNYALNCKDNVQTKISFLEKAATNRYKHSSAAHELGAMYFSGNKIERDYKKAYSYFKLGSEWGNGASTFMLGHCIYEGKGVEKNWRTGFDYMSKGAADAHYLSYVDDYLKEQLTEHEELKDMNILSAYLGHGGYYFVKGITEYLSIFYISFDDFHDPDWDGSLEIIETWKFDSPVFTSIDAIVANVDQTIYIVAAGGSKGALYKIEYNTGAGWLHNPSRINTFKASPMDGVFFECNEASGVIRYGSKGYSKLEYAYR